MTSQTGQIQNQKGQLVVEAVLIMALLAAISLVIQSQLKETKFLEKLIAGPWGSLSGMIECGSWKPCKTPGVHPNTRDRNLSIKPD